MTYPDPEKQAVCSVLLRTPGGPVAAVWGEQGLLSIRLGEELATFGKPSPRFRDFLRTLRHYFRGEKVSFRVRLDLSGMSEFTRRVLDECRKIPYGETATYTDLAYAIGQPGAARAVGQAMGRNPVPVVIPCHRIVASGGGLGGFGCGLEWKAYLLGLEGVTFSSRLPT